MPTSSEYWGTTAPPSSSKNHGVILLMGFPEDILINTIREGLRPQYIVFSTSSHQEAARLLNQENIEVLCVGRSCSLDDVLELVTAAHNGARGIIPLVIALVSAIDEAHFRRCRNTSNFFLQCRTLRLVKISLPLSPA